MKKFTLFVVLLILGLFLGLSGMAHADYIWAGYGGHEYALTQNPGTWTANEAESVSAGGHLVTINSAEEETWLRDTFGGARFWIGFYQIPGSSEPDGGWVWSSGESVTYIHWASGEPNNANQNIAGNPEDKAVMNWNGSGNEYDGWNDLPDSSNEVTGYGIIERNAVVPVPSALILLGTGLVGLGVLGWRRRQVPVS